jgi:hypothetical protein
LRIASRSAGFGYEVVDLCLAAPELRKRLVADDRVLLVLDEVERTGADRLLVDLLGRARLEHCVGVLLRLHAGILHREVGEKRRLGVVERDAHRVVVDALDRLQQLGHAHVVEVRVVRTRHLEVRVVLLPLPLDHEDHVVGVEVARGLPRPVVVPLDALAQVKRIDGAIRRDVPALGEAGHDGGAAALEIDDASVDLAVRVERGAGGVHGGVEILGAAFGAEDQRLRRKVGRDQQRRQRQRRDDGAAAAVGPPGGRFEARHVRNSLGLGCVGRSERTV